jgi:hypothetical protein
LADKCWCRLPVIQQFSIFFFTKHSDEETKEKTKWLSLHQAALSLRVCRGRLTTSCVQSARNTSGEEFQYFGVTFALMITCAESVEVVTSVS